MLLGSRKSFIKDFSRTALDRQDKDKDRAFKDNKDYTCKDIDKFLKLVPKESLRTRINVTAHCSFPKNPTSALGLRPLFQNT